MVRIAAVGMIACFYLWRNLAVLDPLARFSDDFFDYALPARNWVTGQDRPSFQVSQRTAITRCGFSG